MITDLLVPVLLCVICCYALAGKRDVYTLLVTGAAHGLQTVKTILPSLVILLAAVHMLRASGAVELLTKLLQPACAFLGIPGQTLPLLIIRPISGSAALAVGSELIAYHGPDSLIGRTAAVMLGSTETTFYAISVYFGAAKITKIRYTVLAALTADFVGFIMASLTSKLLF